MPRKRPTWCSCRGVEIQNVDVDGERSERVTCTGLAPLSPACAPLLAGLLDGVAAAKSVDLRSPAASARTGRRSTCISSRFSVERLAAHRAVPTPAGPNSVSGLTLPANGRRRSPHESRRALRVFLEALCEGGDRVPERLVGETITGASADCFSRSISHRPAGPGGVSVR